MHIDTNLLIGIRYPEVIGLNHDKKVTPALLDYFIDENYHSDK